MTTDTIEVKRLTKESFIATMTTRMEHDITGLGTSANEAVMMLLRRYHHRITNYTGEQLQQIKFEYDIPSFINRYGKMIREDMMSAILQTSDHRLAALDKGGIVNRTSIEDIFYAQRGIDELAKAFSNITII